MREETSEEKIKLRSGYTTGACATATALAAARLLLTGKSCHNMTILLPRGQQVEFKLIACRQFDENSARADTIKDAGDDPDATHGATVFSIVELSDLPGIRFYAGEGVGTVTRAGLSIGVGEPAINPVPRKMISEHLQSIADEQGFKGGFEVSVGIENGEKIALDTMNGRLGIIGGLSILGTTGIVRPYSCSSYIASIHQSIDVAAANDIKHVAATTGSTSESFVQSQLGMAEIAVVEMGDFAGAVLKHLRKVPMEKLTICGGFGKISKLAAGNQSLHSKDSSIDFEFLSKQAGELGADKKLLDQIASSNTSLEALQYCQQHDIPLAHRICELARDHALSVCHNSCDIEVYAIRKDGGCVGSTEPLDISASTEPLDIGASTEPLDRGASSNSIKTLPP
jgi:cobalt-precorrin-5B (C1)-methyltransferase